MTVSNLVIRNETKDDERKTEILVRDAFMNVYRKGCVEHYVLHKFRDDPMFVPELDFVLELDKKLIGHIIYIRSEIDCDDGRKIPLMTFGPISVAPSHQRQGYGKQLVLYSLKRAKEMGVGAIAITGDIHYYEQFGFTLGKWIGIHYGSDPEADYFLVKELIPGFLDGISGTYQDPEGYFVHEKNPVDFAKYEATF